MAAMAAAAAAAACSVYRELNDIVHAFHASSATRGGAKKLCRVQSTAALTGAGVAIAMNWLIGVLVETRQ